MEHLKSFQKKVQDRIDFFSKKQTLFFCKTFTNEDLSVEDRKNLRKILVQKIQSQSFYKDKYINKFLNLDQLLEIGSRPDQTFLALSISHCKNLAGFVLNHSKEINPVNIVQKTAQLNSKKLSIGLDIEKTNRVSNQTISRVSLLKERNSSPSPSLLWTAKEATFKCLSQNQKSLLLSNCFISNWEKTHFKKTYLFKAEGKKEQAVGIAFFIDDLTLAYAETT